jgi:ABC-type sugar transport system substrate-binding protein
VKLKQIFLVLFIISFIIISSNAKELKVTLVSQSIDGSDFWGVVHKFAEASAQDLDIDFKIAYNKGYENDTYLQTFKEVIESPDRPDFIIGVFLEGVSAKMIELSKKYKTPLFIINLDAPKDEKRLFGGPREHYENYIGLIAPNEEKSGYMLGKYLIQNRKKTDKNVKVVGISGGYGGYEAELRNEGLKRACKEEGAQLYQIVYADWIGENAFRQASGLMNRYSELDIIWGASDLIALHSKKAIQKKQKDIITGGIDWTKEGIEAVKNGTIEGSVGGHFSDAGIALVLIYDVIVVGGGIAGLMAAIEAKSSTNNRTFTYRN